VLINLLLSRKNRESNSCLFCAFYF